MSTVESCPTGVRGSPRTPHVSLRRADASRGAGVSSLGGFPAGGTVWGTGLRPLPGRTGGHCREPLLPWEVDRSARHIPRARCPWAPGSGLGLAPALCQPAAPMFSENLWLVLFSSVGLTVYASWFGAGGERGPGNGLWGAVFFAPFSALSFLSSDFLIPPSGCR